MRLTLFFQNNSTDTIVKFLLVLKAWVGASKRDGETATGNTMVALHDAGDVGDAHQFDRRLFVIGTLLVQRTVEDRLTTEGLCFLLLPREASFAVPVIHL